MGLEAQLEAVLATALQSEGHSCPPRLSQAMAEAVLAGGARLRPQLCLAVAGVTGIAGAEAKQTSTGVWAVASALELLHCASLVHDDLPCFDDASMRRGKPTIHVRFGEALAVLVGDALTMTAFAQLGGVKGVHADAVHREVAWAARRMVWGQALESEPQTDLAQYHGHKTAALFEAATVCGAYLAPEAQTADGTPPTEAWRAFGAHVGALYQMADDILDVARDGGDDRTAKSAGRDGILGRPNGAHLLGLGQARSALEQQLQIARAAIVPGRRHAEVSRWFEALLGRLSAVPGLWATPALRRAATSGPGPVRAAAPLSIGLQGAQA